jgi:hypothetical protein
MHRDPACRLWIRLAGCIVACRERADWYDRWNSCLLSLLVLAGRGEFPGRTSAQLRWICGAAFTDALRTRYAEFDARRWLRGPAPLIGAVFALLLVVTACTRGFAVTRFLIAAGWTQLLPYCIVITFALTVSLTIALRWRAPLRGHDWRYWALLLLKSGAALVLLSVVWMEGGYTLRLHLTNDTLRALGGGFVLTLLYLAAVGWAVLWSLGDQQRRCPVCLRRMISPIRIGSWASVFEPVTTELLCDRGHGALCLQECEMGEPDHWLTLETLSS